MRFQTTTTLLLLSLLPLANGFMPHKTLCSSRASSSSSLAAAISAEEAAKRAATAAATTKPGAAAQQQPKLFDDDLLTDMQECLLKLERRIKEGPGALSLLEVEEFDFATQRILHEMKLNEHNRPKPAPAFPDAAAAPSTPQTGAASQQQSGYGVTDMSLDEGPAYDGTGVGMPKGTVNTYVIPGMDEMEPEEYQKALQASISARQARRVSSGITGNRNSNDYLKNLGAAGKKKKSWSPNSDE